MADIGFFGGVERARRVALAYPLMTEEGRTLDTVLVHRMTAGAVQAYLDAVADGAKGRRFPMFSDVEGKPLDDATLDALDDDDMLALEQAGLDFLPRRFRAEPDSAPTPATGDASQPS